MDQALGTLGGPFQLILRWFLPSVALFSTLVASLVPPVADSTPHVANHVSPIANLASPIASLLLFSQRELVSWVS